MVEAERQALRAGKTRKEAIYAAYRRFYLGDIADEMVRAVQEQGGLLTKADLANWKVEIETPVSTTYRGYEVFKLPFWQQGPVMLQALNLLEQGEGWAIPSMFSTNVIPKEKESPMKMAAPREGVFVGPAGICLVKGGPNQEMALALIDMMLSAEMQDKLQPETYAFPSNTSAKPPLGLAADVKVHNLDWEFVAKERGEWVKRWDREMAM